MPQDPSHDDLERIVFEERSNGRHVCRFTIDGDGTAMVTLETDTGRLRQMCMRADRDTLVWIAATAEGMVHTLDRLEARRAA